MNLPGRYFPSLSRLPAAIAVLLAAVVCGGCFEEPSTDTGKIVPRSELFFGGKPGETIKRKDGEKEKENLLVVQVLGRPIKGVPGRTGFRDPMKDIEVHFTVDPLVEGRPAPEVIGVDKDGKDIPPHAGPPPSVPAVIVRTDDDGYARVKVKLPLAIGEWRVEATIPTEQFATEKGVEFRVASGIMIYKTGDENLVGRKVPIAVQLFKVVNEGGKPKVLPADAKTPLWFLIDGGPESGARMAKGKLADRVRTDDQGVATAELTLGDNAGIYRVIASPVAAVGAEPDQGGAEGRTPPLPPVILRGIALDWTGVGAEILAGGFLFLIGLRFLANGLLNLLGPALVLPVTTFSKSRSRGFVGGVAAGVMFESSSSVVSRLMSFANGGLLAAPGALAVILGVDIGRTVLPNVLAFPIGPASVGLLALGAMGLFLPRRLGLNGWGWVLLGAGLVVLGYWLLSIGFEGASISRNLARSLGEWDYTTVAGAGARLWGFASVVLLTAAVGFVIRNTNLLVVAAIVLGCMNLIGAEASLPIIIGASLGPAVALAVSSLGKRREARRVAIIQLLLQAAGALWLSALSLATIGDVPLILYLVDWLTPGMLYHPQPELVGSHIAMVFTVYNILNAAVGFALARPLLRFTERVVPVDPVTDDIKPYHLDQNLIEVPSLAILQATHEVTYLAELSRKAIAESFDSFRYKDLKLADQTVRREESIAVVHRDVTGYLLRVGENHLSRREACRLQVLHAATGNLVRIGALSERLRDLTARAIEEEAEAPDDVAQELNDIYDLVMGQYENVLRLLERPDVRTQENAVKLAERLAKFGSKVEHAWLEKSRERPRNEGSREPQPAARPATAKEGGDGAPPPSSAHGESAPSPEGPALPSPDGRTAGLDGKSFARLLIFRESLEILFQAAGHLSHIAERMRVLTQ